MKRKKKMTWTWTWLLLVYLCCNIVLKLTWLVQGSASAVKFLPGFQGPLPFQLQTGYIGVGEGDDVQLFYYFVKSESDHQVDPLLLWMTGGPGCSSLTGLVYEIGPLAFADVLENGVVPRLVLNPNSWTETASIIFVDSPVGTGFSYSRSSKGAKSTGLQTCTHIYQFLVKFLAEYPEFISNPLYIGGDSFAGLLVPVVAELISNGNENGFEPWINLKGYVMGNPLATPSDDNYRVPFAHGMGIISDELYASLKLNCKGVYSRIDPSNTKCLRPLVALDQAFYGIRFAHVLEPDCGFYGLKPEEKPSGRKTLLEKLQLPPSFRCRDDGYEISNHWANDEHVRDALHIRKGTIKNWVRCNLSLPITHWVLDVVSYHAKLSSKGYRSLIYSGDHDMIVPFLATQAWIRSLNYSIVDDRRQWMVGGQVAGYTRTYANQMTFATVKGAGHTAPEYKPAECKAIFKRWMSHKPL